MCLLLRELLTVMLESTIVLLTELVVPSLQVGLTIVNFTGLGLRLFTGTLMHIVLGQLKVLLVQLVRHDHLDAVLECHISSGVMIDSILDRSEFLQDFIANANDTQVV